MRNIICWALSITVVYCSTSSDGVHGQIKEQYSKIASVDQDSLRWVEQSHDMRENRACVVFKGIALYIVSGVINSNLQSLWNVDKDENISVDTNINTQPEFNISMFDILYLYCDIHSGKVVTLQNSEELGNIVLNNRSSQNRKIVENIIRRFAVKCGDLPKKLQDLCDVHIAKLINMKTTSKTGEAIEELIQWKAAITDFLKRVELYINDTKWAANEVKISSKHKQRDKEILLQEIRSIGVVVQETEQALNTSLNTTKLKLLSICLRVYNIIAGVQPSFKGENEQRVGYRDIKEIFAGIMHTEQIIDWLSIKYNEQILFLFNGKTPCVKCSEYIECCAGAHALWESRVNIGCNCGWRDNNKDRNVYWIQTKVFNDKEADGKICAKVLLLPNEVLRNNREQINNIYKECDDSRHDYNIKCYAIGNYSSLGWMMYKGQLVMQENTSVIQNQIESNADVLLPILGQIVEARNVILPEAEEDTSDQLSTWNAKQALRNADIAEKIKANNAKIQAWFDERCNIA